jgi:hypothetical protein
MGGYKKYLLMLALLAQIKMEAKVQEVVLTVIITPLILTIANP